MDLHELEPFKKRRVNVRDTKKDEQYLREYSDDGFRIINSDASQYVSGNRDLDFMNLINLIDVEKYFDKEL